MAEYKNLALYLSARDTTINNLLLTHYLELGLSNEEFLVYLQVKMMIDEGAREPSTEKIGQALGWTPQVVFNHLTTMRNKGLLSFTTQRGGDGRVTTLLDFEPMYEQLLNLDFTGMAAASTRILTPLASEKNEDTTKRAEIYHILEQEFGRQLTPMEYETIGSWFNKDQFDPALIKQAIQEAVINQALSLRYIETILVSWQKKNYRSVQEVLAHREYRQNRQEANVVDIPDIPMDIDPSSVDWSKL
ncbi:DNA replication protein DnaD [Weissella oryzae SG25]|uniref:DNA replication protein DnaD n=1 Tax=Weissella oryzae (strain DSM 25784 / JCM 18191 / LMG 30913 / SG25) TaxID=1329250 RepID=A0A069CXF3_WEIOS|nr:DnaD domain protein [Weissella oryzae]GAK32047.1 DNA replication protein DnaD [Weissella oryzae SG25]